MPTFAKLGLGVIGALVVLLVILAYFYKAELKANIGLQQQNEMRQVEKAGNDAGEKVYDKETGEQDRRNQAVHDAWATAKPEHDDPVDPELLRVLEASGIYKSTGEPEVSGGCSATGASDRCSKNQ